MPRGLDISIQADVSKVSEDLTGVARRMVNAKPAFTKVQQILERGEQRLFDRAHGKYVKSGRTRESLTQEAAPDAVREARGDRLTFGTSVWYAKFLRKGKKSAVLVLRPTERKQASQVLLDFFMGRQ